MTGVQTCALPIFDQLESPKGMSLIARTAGIGRSAAELQWDLNYMLKLWDAIDGAAKAGKGAFLIYQESSLVIRAIRDYFTADIGAFQLRAFAFPRGNGSML